MIFIQCFFVYLKEHAPTHHLISTTDWTVFGTLLRHLCFAAVPAYLIISAQASVCQRELSGPS